MNTEPTNSRHEPPTGAPNQAVPSVRLWALGLVLVTALVAVLVMWLWGPSDGRSPIERQCHEAIERQDAEARDYWCLMLP